MFNQTSRVGDQCSVEDGMYENETSVYIVSGSKIAAILSSDSTGQMEMNF